MPLHVHKHMIIQCGIEQEANFRKQLQYHHMVN